MLDFKIVNEFGFRGDFIIAITRAMNGKTTADKAAISKIVFMTVFLR